MQTRLLRDLLCVLLTAGALGCGAQPGSTEAEPEPLLLYSGRNESLIGPILERFTEDTGVEVAIRYGGTAELAATLLEEGEHTPADAFISQDAAALWALSNAGMLRPLDEAIVNRIAAPFRSPVSDWVGLSGRARTVVYNTDVVDPGQLPARLEDVLRAEYRGRFGVAPTNGSFQAHMAAYRAVAGRRSLATLLDGMVANEPRRYPKNGAIVEAVIAGEVEWGLVNHYYLWRVLRENPEAPAANYFMPGGGASGFVNVSGVGLLSDHPNGRRLVDYLLSEKAQRYFAEETFEYPLVDGVVAAEGLPALETLAVGEVDFGQVAMALDETLSMISESGLIH